MVVVKIWLCLWVIHKLHFVSRIQLNRKTDLNFNRESINNLVYSFNYIQDSWFGPFVLSNKGDDGEGRKEFRDGIESVLCPYFFRPSTSNISVSALYNPNPK
jgi:hypothetical protein